MEKRLSVSEASQSLTNKCRHSSQCHRFFIWFLTFVLDGKRSDGRAVFLQPDSRVSAATTAGKGEQMQSCVLNRLRMVYLFCTQRVPQWWWRTEAMVRHGGPAGVGRGTGAPHCSAGPVRRRRVSAAREQPQQK